MNKENLQFRAWLENEKKMVDVESISFKKIRGRNNEVVRRYPQIIVSVSDGISKTEWMDNSAVLMQYTGLKDTNGKEIYEGDIVGVENIYSGHGVRWQGIVKFSECQYMLKVQSAEHTVPLKYLLRVNRYVKIIGNIYENPELLEQNK